MKNFIQNVYVAFVVKCLLQLLLTFVAVYGIMYEVPRSTGEKCFIVGCVIAAGLITLVLTFQKLNSEKENEKKIKESEHMIRYLSYNSKPGKAVLDLVIEALSTACSDIGYSTMAIIPVNDDIKVAAFKSEDDNKFSSFALLDEKIVSNIFYNAKSIEINELKKTSKSVYREEKFLKTNNDIGHFITYCLGVLNLSPGGNFTNQDDCMYYAKLFVLARNPNEHIRKMDIEVENGKIITIDTYIFTKEQYEALKGTTRFEASKFLLQWFDEAGIDLFSKC